MPLDTIYLTRHGHRMNWTIDYSTGTYHARFPTPTGNPADPTLTAHGVQQSHELATHLTSEQFTPKPCRIYSSPFYRCLQTIQPTVEGLEKLPGRQDSAENNGVRIENGLGEWFGASTYFDHPPPSSPSELRTHFPSIISSSSVQYKAHVIPSSRGETISQLHNRVATALAAIIADVDAEIQAQEEARSGSGTTTSSKAILICSHAAPLIAMGRALTGDMPEDVNVEDFHVYTAGLSTFVRRKNNGTTTTTAHDTETRRSLLAPGTKLIPETEVRVPEWVAGRGVGGGWDCVRNGDCSFLSGGEERGWHFNGEESFDTGPMAADNESAKL